MPNVILAGSAGQVAETHKKVIGELHADYGVEFVAFADPEGPREVTLARGQRPVPVYQSIGQALLEHEAQIVVNATPTGRHASVCNEIFSAPASSVPLVLVEKPTAHTPKALEEMNVAKPPSTKLETLYHFSYSPEVFDWASARLPEWIYQYGPIVKYDAHFTDPRKNSESAHKRQQLHSHLLDLGSNALSVLARFVDMDSIQNAELTGDVQDDAYTLRLRFPAGAYEGTGCLKTNWNSRESYYGSSFDFVAGARLLLDHTDISGSLVDKNTYKVIEEFSGGDPITTGMEGRYRNIYRRVDPQTRRSGHYKNMYAGILDRELRGAEDVSLSEQASSQISRLLFSTLDKLDYPSHLYFAQRERETAVRAGRNAGT